MPRARHPTFVLRAGAISLGAHGALLLALALRAATGPGEAALMADRVAGVHAAGPEGAPDDATWIDVEPAEPPAGLLAPEPAPETPPVPGDEARSVAGPTAPRRGLAEDPAPPAPDTGTGPGRTLPAALRRDTSTLRTRLADGAEVSRRSRERTAGRPSSPQAMRQERVVGVGDSARTRRPRSAEAVAPAALPVDDASALDPGAAPEPSGARADEGRDRARGEGPLDADRGEKRFDVATEGPARETQFTRAASDEPRPGRMDLSAAAAPGPRDGDTGRGPADRPGATSRAAAGSAPALHGAPIEAAPGDLALGTVEREYLRQYAEIKRRVDRAVVFPRRLALALEQGEAIVQFVVRPDGRLEGSPRLVKSAGFPEFDAEAVSAVTRAAPFPPMPRPLSISMRIGFDNPLVR